MIYSPEVHVAVLLAYHETLDRAIAAHGKLREGSGNPKKCIRLKKSEIKHHDAVGAVLCAMKKETQK